MTTNDDAARQPSLTFLAAAVDAAPTPLDRLTALRALTRRAEQLERTAVAEARAGRASWQEVGDRLEVSKQAVQKRFTDRPETPATPATPATNSGTQPAKAPRSGGWEVTTPRGRTLLKLRRTSHRI